METRRRSPYCRYYERRFQTGRINESIEIESQVDKVFAYTTVAKDWPKWHDYIPEAEQTSHGPVRVGTTFKGKTRMWGLTLDWTGKVIEYEPYKRWRLIVDAEYQHR
ncbi:MAG: SRPBCC family protein [Halobacteriota archaeon]